jgi:hypothetical protein
VIDSSSTQGAVDTQQSNPSAMFSWDGNVSDAGLVDASQMWLWSDNLEYQSFSELSNIFPWDTGDWCLNGLDASCALMYALDIFIWRYQSFCRFVLTRGKLTGILMYAFMRNPFSTLLTSNGWEFLRPTLN